MFTVRVYVCLRGGGLCSVFRCGVMLGWTVFLSLCVCGSLVLEMKGFCWCVCIVLLVHSCMSSVVLPVSS